MPKRYSQNDEQRIILKYFGTTPGTFLDIGANDGETFSNTRALWDLDWHGVLVEPSPVAFAALKRNSWRYATQIWPLNFALGKENTSGTAEMYEGSDTLVSSMCADRLAIWERGGTKFTPILVKTYAFKHLLEISPFQTFDFISIDAEGLDYDILAQMDLMALGCRMLCIEYGDRLASITRHANNHGLREVHRNGENIIFAQ